MTMRIMHTRHTMGFVARGITMARFTALMACGLLFGVTSVQADTRTQFNASCATCHSAGVLGAPKSGDKSAWAPRMKQGMPTLVSHVKNGYKNMPARGLCDDCKDSDYEALIRLMAE